MYGLTEVPVWQIIPSRLCIDACPVPLKVMSSRRRLERLLLVLGVSQHWLLLILLFYCQSALDFHFPLRRSYSNCPRIDLRGLHDWETALINNGRHGSSRLCIGRNTYSRNVWVGAVPLSLLHKAPSIIRRAALSFLFFAPGRSSQQRAGPRQRAGLNMIPPTRRSAPFCPGLIWSTQS